MPQPEAELKTLRLQLAKATGNRDRTRRLAGEARSAREPGWLTDATEFDAQANNAQREIDDLSGRIKQLEAKAKR